MYNYLNIIEWWFCVFLANTCILILIGQLQTDVVHSEEPLLAFLLYQVFTQRLVSYRCVSSTLTICQKVRVTIYYECIEDEL